MPLSETEQAKVTQLTGLGLPEDAAVKCAQAITAGANATGKPCQIYGEMKVKEGADIAALTTALKAYGTASAAAPGQLACSYTIKDGKLVMFETFNSINAYFIHVGHCFPDFVNIVPHCDMTTLNATCDASEIEFWTTACSSWGAQNVTVGEAI